jgi:hypothetical protein
VAHAGFLSKSPFYFFNHRESGNDSVARARYRVFISLKRSDAGLGPLAVNHHYKATLHPHPFKEKKENAACKLYERTHSRNVLIFLLLPS